MKSILNHLFIICTCCFLLLSISSCKTTSGTTVTSYGKPLSNYKYVIVGQEATGDMELTDIIVEVQNKLSSKLLVVTPSEAANLDYEGIDILKTKISVKSEMFDLGHTYISITLNDYRTGQLIGVLKANGIGPTVKQDQKLALKGIKKEIDKAFK